MAGRARGGSARNDEKGRLLAVVRLDEPLDELVDVARLGQATLGQQVAELGLGQALVALAGHRLSLPRLLTLDLGGLTGKFMRRPLGVLVRGLFGLGGLGPGGLVGRLGLLAHRTGQRGRGLSPPNGEAAVQVYRALHQVEIALDGRDEIYLRHLGKAVRQRPRTLAPEVSGLLGRGSGLVSSSAVLPGQGVHIYSSGSG